MQPPGNRFPDPPNITCITCINPPPVSSSLVPPFLGSIHLNKNSMANVLTAKLSSSRGKNQVQSFVSPSMSSIEFQPFLDRITGKGWTTGSRACKSVHSCSRRSKREPQLISKPRWCGQRAPGDSAVSDYRSDMPIALSKSIYWGDERRGRFYWALFFMLSVEMRLTQLCNKLLGGVVKEVPLLFWTNSDRSICDLCLSRLTYFYIIFNHNFLIVTLVNFVKADKRKRQILWLTSNNYLSIVFWKRRNRNCHKRKKLIDKIFRNISILLTPKFT